MLSSLSNWNVETINSRVQHFLLQKESQTFPVSLTEVFSPPEEDENPP